MKEEAGREKFDDNKNSKVNSKKPVVEEKDKQSNNKKNVSKSYHNKHNRKRSQVMLGSKCHKRRRIDYSRRFIPPTKFLLGGNIHDPLNLNSLQDEEINRAMNAVTPKSSPLPTPQHRKGEIEVIIPPNICDPLNLAQCDDENTADYEAQFILPLKKMKRPKKKRKKSSCAMEETHLNEASKTEPVDSDCHVKSALDITETEISIPIAIESLPPVPTIEPAIPDEGAQTLMSAEVSTAPPQTHTPKKVTKKESLNHSLELKLQNRRFDVKDKIVSPVVPQPTHRVINSRFRQLTPEIAKGQKTPNFREKNCKFQYGNYHKYYGYRNFHQEVDPRIKILNKYKHVFHKKDVLDIGCNIGHITLTVARDFNANSIVGLDIDKHLIKVARTNIKHYVTCKNSPLDDHEGREECEKLTPVSTFPGPFPTEQEERGEFKKPYANISNVVLSKSDDKKDKEGIDEAPVNPDVFFPISMPIVYGGIDVPGIPSKLSNQFPHNVSFVQGNYVLDSDFLLNMEQAQFDVILCLSVTKWFHLNWGDSGIKRVFMRMYAQLREGGVLILEPQGFQSYKKKRKLTDTIWRNFQAIEFFPHHFTEYLLSEVGFTKCETLGSPLHPSKGFQRPIKMFTKGSKRDSRSGKEINPSGEWT
ncbi:hypothetical protein M8J75_006149 [Diaphorina citri]|nr:hypothetical protein M8J75_006149 [Diaphorina citri]KAI5752578.1 hypothetical protein M8J77_018342 [Diaphorina citri]